MSKLSITIFSILLVVALALTTRAISANKENMPYLGKWTGKFSADRFSGKADGFALNRHSMSGFVQLYKSNDKFILHLDGEQESVEARGTWTHKGPEIRLKVTDVDIDDMGGEEMRDPNRVFLNPRDLRASISQPITLRMSRDKKRLVGLTTTLVNVVGTFEFVKDLQ